MLFLLLASSLWWWVVWDAFVSRVVTGSPSADYWEHSATLRALMAQPFSPENPHLKSDASSPRFVPVFVLVALISRPLGFDALDAMGLVTAVNTSLFVLGAYCFFRSYFRTTWAPVYGLVVLVASWWDAWNFSNVYQLRVLFAVAGYPSTTALGGAMLLFALELSLLRSAVRRPRALVVLTLGWAFVLITHPLTAMLALCGGCLLAATLPVIPFRRRVLVLATVPVGCLLTALWPYFSTIQVLRGGNAGDVNYWIEDSVRILAEGGAEQRAHFFYRITGLQKTLGLALIGAAAIPVLIVLRRHWFITLGAFAMAVPFVANLYVPIPLGHRFILLCVFYLQVALVWFLLRLAPVLTPAHPSWAQRSRAVLGAISVLALLGTALRHNYEQASWIGHRQGPGASARRAKAIARTAGEDAVILADAQTSWAIPTFGPKVLCLLHSNPLVSDEGLRAANVRRFLRPGASDAFRLEVLKKYEVTHVVLNRRQERAIAGFLRPRAYRRLLPGGLVLYRLRARSG